jgi:hypothetical protein
VTVSGILSGSVNPLSAGLALARSAARIQPLRPVTGLPGRRADDSSSAASSSVDSLFEARDVVELSGPHGDGELPGPQQTEARKTDAHLAGGQGPRGDNAARFRLDPCPAAQFIDTQA